MVDVQLTRKQQELYEFLLANQQQFDQPPTLDELCLAMGLKSRGSLHKHIQGLVDAGLVEPLDRKQRGVRLTGLTNISIDNNEQGLPFVGKIAAGSPIEAIEDITYMFVPEQLKTELPCYVLLVKGESMIDEGIYDGDWVVIEQRSYARNGEIVVALVEDQEATLKRLRKRGSAIALEAANPAYETRVYRDDQVKIQGRLVGLIRTY